MTDCGLDTVLALIGGKWKMLILYHVCHAPRRFGELRRLLPGISEKMLIQDLRQMQESNLGSHWYKRMLHEKPRAAPRSRFKAADL